MTRAVAILPALHHRIIGYGVDRTHPNQLISTWFREKRGRAMGVPT